MANKIHYPIGIDTMTDADGKARTALVDSKRRVLCELTFGADIYAISEIVNRVNGTDKRTAKPSGTDTRKNATSAYGEMTQAFWSDVIAPEAQSADAHNTRLAAFKDLERAIDKAVMAYWKATEGTR